MTKRNEWLEDAIEEHIKNNPRKDSVEIVSHFKLSADIILESLTQLVKDKKVVREHLGGVKYGYFIKE